MLGFFGLILGTGLSAQTTPAPSSETSVHVRDGSVDDYRQHLVQLQTLLEACSKARDAKSCDPALVGPDDRVPITIGSITDTRLVRFDWLRSVFDRAGQSAKNPKEPADPAKSAKQALGITGDELPASELLKAAKTRLEYDLAQSNAPVAPAPDHTKERAVMQQVLAGAEFRGLQEQTVKDSVLEKIARWLNRLFASAAGLKARSAWIGRLIVWGFIAGVCVALGYGLLRLERRWRLRLTPDDEQRPAPDAASARDWQLWLEDARRAAASGKWREAIHFLYWASISRLEFRRLWPADRARTPREYLALVAPEDLRRPGLSQLTLTFERFWYGGRAATQSDYTAAESVASALIGGNTPAGTTGGAEGGGR
jgi:hypothetical protein